MKLNTYKIKPFIVIIISLFLVIIDSGFAFGRASVVNGCWNGNPNYPFWPRTEENDLELMQDISFVDLSGTKRRGNRIFAKILYVGPHRELPGRKKAKEDIVTYSTEVFEERSPERVAHYSGLEAWEKGKPDAVFDPGAEYGSLLSILQQDYLMIRGSAR